MFRSIAVCFLFLALRVSAETIYVANGPACVSNPSGGSGAASNPFCRIQDGIDMASYTPAGDVVSVAAGTYTGNGNKNLQLEGKEITVTCAAARCGGPAHDTCGSGFGSTRPRRDRLLTRTARFKVM